VSATVTQPAPHRPPRRPRRRRRHHLHVPFGRTAIVIELLAALAFLFYLLSHEGLQLPFLSHDYTIRAEFVNAGGLNPADQIPVLVAGVPEGQVASVRYRDGLAIATLQLPDSVRKLIHSDATINVVPRSALEDLTVEIDPGSAGLPPLRAGAVVPPSRTSAAVRFDRLIDVLDANTRAQLQIMLSELAIGLNGRPAALRGALAQLSSLVYGTTTVSSQLAERRVLLSRLVGSLDEMVSVLGARQSDLAGAVADGQRTLAVTAARSLQLARIVQELPAALSRLSGAMGALRSLSVPLDPALSELPPFARALPGALSALRRFDPAGVRLLGDLRALIAQGSLPAADLERALAALGPAAGALRPTAADLQPVLADINQHRQGIGEVGDNFNGVFSTNDVNGPILRGLGAFEQFNPADVGFPGASGASLARAQSESVQALTRVCLRINPLACIARYLIPGLPGSVVPLSQAPRIVGRLR
jgi:virulence factor Mce-like protein